MRKKNGRKEEKRKKKYRVPGGQPPIHGRTLDRRKYGEEIRRRDRLEEKKSKCYLPAGTGLGENSSGDAKGAGGEGGRKGLNRGKILKLEKRKTKSKIGGDDDLIIS